MNAKLAALLAELDRQRTEIDQFHWMTVHVSQYDLLREALREREGMVLVPREPTEVMIEAGYELYEKDAPTAGIHVARIYRAMLAAAEGK